MMSKPLPQIRGNGGGRRLGFYPDMLTFCTPVYCALHIITPPHMHLLTHAPPHTRVPPHVCTSSHVYLLPHILCCSHHHPHICMCKLRTQLHAYYFPNHRAVIQGVANLMNLLSPFIYADHLQVRRLRMILLIPPHFSILSSPSTLHFRPY